MSSTEANDQCSEGKHFPMTPLLDFLVPPSGLHVERALCASYSAQSSVLAAMLMAMNGDVAANGSGSSVALARALRRLTGKVQFLIQHGRLAAPRARRAVLGILDRFIVAVPFDERTHEGASWHPKVFLIRYAPDAKATKGQLPFWKLWIGSRNFTRDGSWDIGFSLTSDPAQSRGQVVPGLDVLALKLAEQAGKQTQWATSIRQLATARWQVPKGMTVRDVNFLLPGEERSQLPRVPPRPAVLLAVAPFIDARTLRRLADATPGAVRTLISTQECIASAAAQQTSWTDSFDLRSLPAGSQDTLMDEPEAAGDDEEPEMGGLHAKFLWFEHRDGATLQLGSPNLTSRGWNRNAEAYITLDIAKRGSSDAAMSVYEGIQRFRSRCNCVSLTELPPPSDNTVAELLEQERKMLAFSLQATQCLQSDNTVTVTSHGQPRISAGVSLSVGRIGDIALPWHAPCAPLALPAAPRWENSDLLHIKISADGQEVAWLQHAPFVPALSEDDRDLPLLQSFLGLNGLLDWLAEVLSGAGSGTGTGCDWDNDSEKKPAGHTATTLPFSVEAVLAAWVRDPASLQEARAVMTMARNYAGDHRDDREVRERLQSFLQSWPILEAHLQ